MPGQDELAKRWPLAIDLFAGCGGLTLGLKKAHFKVVGAVEIDELAVETYRMNHPTVSHIWNKDIREVPGSDVLITLGLKRGELDLLAGCPPCQGFSSMTTLNGSRKVDDPRNDLVHEYSRLVKEILPRALLLENVPGLVTNPLMNTLMEDLESLGYNVKESWKVLDAADYGVPQRRRRLVMMSVRNGEVKFAPPKVGIATVREAIGKLGRAGKSGDPLHDVTENRTVKIQKLIRAIPKNGGSRSSLGKKNQLPCHQRSDGFKDVYGRMFWDKPAPTITSGCQSPSKGRFIHPSENRTISLREAAILQGFPANYRFSMKNGKLAAAAMIGNAVPPAFVSVQAVQLRSAIARSKLS